MRLWTLHPRYLDRAGLTGGWREALLAQAVLAGRTRGYRSHPQLERFRAHPQPLAAVAAYLEGLAAEAQQRGYRFDRSRIDPPRSEPPPHGAPRIDSPPHDRSAGVTPIRTTEGQVLYEWQHLRAKLDARSPEWAAGLPRLDRPGELPEVHPLFVVEPGPIEGWERTTPPSARPSAPRGGTRPS
jgi:hypothetical protein